MRIKLAAVVAVLALGLIGAKSAPAQGTLTVVTITMDGGNGTLSGCPNILTENGLGVTGNFMCLSGSQQCGPGFGIEMENPGVPPLLPNNGFMCGFYNTLSYGAKNWGTRADGSTMNGTQAGDYFVQVATTQIPVENNDPGYWGNVPVVPVNVTLLLEMTYKPVVVCRRGQGCHTVLQPFLTQGSGTLQFVEGQN